MMDKFEDRVTVSGLTDVGRVRRQNEDSFSIDADLGLVLICDGMGEHDRGNVASAMAVEAIKDFLYEYDPNISDAQSGQNLTDESETLEDDPFPLKNFPCVKPSPGPIESCLAKIKSAGTGKVPAWAPPPLAYGSPTRGGVAGFFMSATAGVIISIATG
ncbi:MAG: protein phosphatase [bacterium]|nr:MAG: protein phosphatase [bacterium]